MAFKDLMDQVRRLYAAKHYDEAVKKADLIPNADTSSAVKDEDRAFLGKVYMKVGLYDYASDLIRKCKTTTIEDLSQMKKVAFKLKKSSSSNREASAIHTIFEDAVKDIANGVHFQIAIKTLDLLPSTEAHICYLHGLSKFNEGAPRHAKAILEGCVGCVRPYYLERKNDELVSECSNSIDKCLHDLLGNVSGENHTLWMREL